MVDNLFKKFRKSNILVIGDVMIDAYWIGRVTRVSPEAPVPVLEVNQRDYRLGGAANVALNIKSLGANPILCAVIGQDEHEPLFTKLLNENGLSNEGIVSLPQRATTVKYRMIANKTQMIRVDEENSTPLKPEEQIDFVKRVDDLIGRQTIDAIIFEDYDKGLLSQETIAHIVSLAQSKKIVIAVDPKKRNFHYYQGVTLFKPNLKELKDGLFQDDETLSLKQIHKLMQNFAHKMNIDYMMTTLSERGIAIYDLKKDNFSSYPAFLRKIGDVSGAGDTVISVATLSLLAGIPATTMAAMANLAGGIVCEYAGVVPIDATVFKEQLQKEALLP